MTGSPETVDKQTIGAPHPPPTESSGHAPHVETQTAERVTFHPVTPDNITLFEQLCLKLFPVRYSTQFYLEVLHAGPLAVLGPF